MSRYLSIVFLISVAFLLFAAGSSFAQNEEYDRARQDYLFNYNLYRASHISYVSAKNEYLTYKTLTSETRALDNTRAMLEKRAEALRTYLQALRLKLSITTGVINYQQSLQFLQLDNEIGWLISHKEALTSPASITDLLKVSATLEKKYPKTELLSYQTLGTVLSGKLNAQREKINIQTREIGTKLAQIKNEGEEVSKLERWLLEAEKKVTSSKEKQTEAENIIGKIKSSNKNKKKEFSKAQFAYEEANQYLKESVSFLSEILREIKYE